MRKPKGKLIALLAGVMALGVLGMVGMVYWKDIYCHLFLDPRLVGKWAGEVTTDVEELLCIRGTYEFDQVGNIHATLDTGDEWAGRYRIEGNSLTYEFLFPALGPISGVYRVWPDDIKGDGITIHHLRKDGKRTPSNLRRLKTD